jgi:hypothetical protein
MPVQYITYNLDKREIDYIIEQIGSDNTNLENIYKNVIQLYTKSPHYITARYNIGISSVPIIGNPEVSTIRYHTDINSSNDCVLTTSLLYLDEAKLDYKDENNIEQTLHIQPGTLVIFNSNTFIHRTNPFGVKNRRLLQYFFCHEEPRYPIYYLLENDNKFIYKLHEITRQYNLVFPEMVELQHIIMAGLIVNNIGVTTSNIGNQHGEHIANSSFRSSIYTTFGLTFRRFEIIT